jgi:hypothetical protein
MRRRRMSEQEREKIEALYKKFHKEKKLLDINDIKEWEDNPNNDYSQVPRLAKIFEAFGQITPITIWSKDMVSYKGNHTVRAMKLLNQKKIEAEVVDFPDRATAELYGLADNESAKMSVLDDMAIVKLLKAKRISSFADKDEIRMITGFDEKKFKSLMMSTEDMPTELPDVKIEGFVPSKTDFVVIQFENKSDLEKFKALAGIKVSHQRVIPFELISKFIDLDSKLKKRRLIRREDE